MNARVFLKHIRDPANLPTKAPQWLRTLYEVKSKRFNVRALLPSPVSVLSDPMLQGHRHPCTFPKSTRWVQVCDLRPEWPVLPTTPLCARPTLTHTESHPTLARASELTGLSSVTPNTFRPSPSSLRTCCCISVYVATAEEKACGPHP